MHFNKICQYRLDIRRRTRTPRTWPRSRPGGTRWATSSSSLIRSTSFRRRSGSTPERSTPRCCASRRPCTATRARSTCRCSISARAGRARGARSRRTWSACARSISSWGKAKVFEVIFSIGESERRARFFHSSFYFHDYRYSLLENDPSLQLYSRRLKWLDLDLCPEPLHLCKSTRALNQVSKLQCFSCNRHPQHEIITAGSTVTYCHNETHSPN